MTSIKPVSFQSQTQNFNPSEFMIVRRPSQEDIKNSRRRHFARSLGMDVVMAGVFTGAQAVFSKGKIPAKELGKYFAQTLGLFVALSAAIQLIFNRKG